ncbi:hypothetical protein KBC89_02155 [Candidatus Woesebacteria bacterium]|nr:hypothetical protein [Candidatus Woesebacteria bacterium]
MLNPEKKPYSVPSLIKYQRLQKVTLGTVSHRIGQAPDSAKERPQKTGCSGDWKTPSKWH